MNKFKSSLQDRNSRFYEECQEVAYIGGDSKIKVGKVVKKEDINSKGLMLEVEGGGGYSYLSKNNLII